MFKYKCISFLVGESINMFKPYSQLLVSRSDAPSQDMLWENDGKIILFYLLWPWVLKYAESSSFPAMDCSFLDHLPGEFRELAIITQPCDTCMPVPGCHKGNEYDNSSPPPFPNCHTSFMLRRKLK